MRTTIKDASILSDYIYKKATIYSLFKRLSILLVFMLSYLSDKSFILAYDRFNVVCATIEDPDKGLERQDKSGPVLRLVG